MRSTTLDIILSVGMTCIGRTERALAPLLSQEELQIMYGKGTPNGMEIKPDRIAFTEQCARAIIKRQAREKAQAQVRVVKGSSADQAGPKPMAVETEASCSPRGIEPAAKATGAGGTAPRNDSSGGGGDAKPSDANTSRAASQLSTGQSLPSSTTASSLSTSASSAATNTGLSFAARAAAKAASAPVLQRPQSAATAAKLESKEEARDRMYQEAFERMRKKKEEQELLRKKQEEEVR